MEAVAPENKIIEVRTDLPRQRDERLISDVRLPPLSPRKRTSVYRMEIAYGSGNTEPYLSLGVSKSFAKNR